MTKNSLFTQFLRLSGMRPGVGNKGKYALGEPQLYHPLTSYDLSISLYFLE